MVDTQLLRAAIARRGLKYRAVADDLGVTYATLRFKIRGEREFTASEIKKFSDLLGVSLEEREKLFFK